MNNVAFTCNIYIHVIVIFACLKYHGVLNAGKKLYATILFYKLFDKNKYLKIYYILT